MQALLEEIDRRDWQVAVPAGAVFRRGVADPGRRGSPRCSATSARRSSRWMTRSPAPAGLLCPRSGHADVVDVSVALCARQRNLHVVTSDPQDLRAVDDALRTSCTCPEGA